MIKEQYNGLTFTIQSGGSNRKIEVFEGMSIAEIEVLKKNGINVLEDVPKDEPKKKVKKVKMVEPKEEEDGEA
jgi:hypothetical protein